MHGDHSGVYLEHGNDASAALIIPGDVESAIKRACSVDGNSVQLFECLDEVVSVFLVYIFHAKHYDYKGKRDGMHGTGE